MRLADEWGMVAISQFDYTYTRRTLEQLHNSNAGPYEVTNLINSLLGLLLVPKETIFASLPEVQIGRASCRERV